MAESNLSLQEWFGYGGKALARANGTPVPGKTQKVAYTVASAATTIPLTVDSHVYVVSTTDCFVRQGGVGVTAVADVDIFLPAKIPFVMKMGQAEDGTKFTLIAAVRSTVDGSLYVTPLEGMSTRTT